MHPFPTLFALHNVAADLPAVGAVVVFDRVDTAPFLLHMTSLLSSHRVVHWFTTSAGDLDLPVGPRCAHTQSPWRCVCCLLSLFCVSTVTCRAAVSRSDVGCRCSRLCVVTTPAFSAFSFRSSALPDNVVVHTHWDNPYVSRVLANTTVALVSFGVHAAGLRAVEMPHDQTRPLDKNAAGSHGMALEAIMCHLVSGSIVFLPHFFNYRGAFAVGGCMCARAIVTVGWDTMHARLGPNQLALVEVGDCGI